MADFQKFVDEINSDTIEFAKRINQASDQRNNNVKPRETPRIEVESNTLYSNPVPRQKIVDAPSIPLDSCRLWYSNPVTYS